MRKFTQFVKYLLKSPLGLLDAVRRVFPRKGSNVAIHASVGRGPSDRMEKLIKEILDNNQGQKYFGTGNRVESRDGRVGTITRIYRHEQSGIPVFCVVEWDNGKPSHSFSVPVE